MKKTNNAETSPVSDQTDEVRHCLVRYWTEIMNAGMLMPVLVCSMPMASYDVRVHDWA
jgi:hypothetical protein